MSSNPTAGDGNSSNLSDIPMHVEDEKPDQNTEEEQVETVEGEDDDSSSFVSPPPYLPEQRVLCRDVTSNNTNEQYYEAVVRKVRCVNDNEWKFYIHYQGWNSRWDCWVSASDLVHDTEENRKVFIKEVPSRKRKKDADSSTASGSGGGGSGRKRKTSSSSDSTGSTLAYYQQYCELPFTLKTILVEECEKITRKGYDSPHGYDCELSAIPPRSVHQLPAPVTIKQVLQHYQKKRGGSSEDEEKQQQVRRFCDGLGKLFEDALPFCLLYPQERPQYESILRDETLKDKSLCEIYGCEMLLRLMVRLPVLLQAEPKRETSLSMGPLLADLIVLLQKNKQACFKSVYREPKYEEYLDWEKQVYNSFQTVSDDSGSMET